MVNTTLLVVLFLGQSPPPTMEGDQLMEVLKGLHSGIRDFQLVCEGQVHCPAASEVERKKWESRFQGIYAYRAADGAAYLDLYTKPVDVDASFRRSTFAYLKGKRFEFVRSSDQKFLPFKPSENPRGPRCMTNIGSPERFIFINLWQQLAYGFKDQGYAGKRYMFKGWEDIDGNQTIHISIDEYPKSTETKKYISHYWIDLKRGGHVLKEEFYQGNDLWYRVHNIRIAPVASEKGQEVWFPLHAELDSFLLGTESKPTPVFHEVYGVVSGTLVLNQGLGDERFSIDWKGVVAKSDAFDQIARDYRASPSKPIVVPRTDPAGVMEDQQKRLAEADQQAKQLDASPASGRGWNLAHVVQYGLTAVGAGLLIFALVLGRGRRLS